MAHEDSEAYVGAGAGQAKRGASWGRQSWQIVLKYARHIYDVGRQAEVRAHTEYSIID